MKTCPFCAEEIQDAAIKCRHCGSALIEGSGSSTATSSAQNTDPKAVASPLRALGGLIIFGGLWLLFMGISEYYGGSSTRDLYSGTPLAADPGVMRITDNAMSAGTTKLLFGLLALIVGGAVSAAGRRASATVAGSRAQEISWSTALGSSDLVAAAPPVRWKFVGKALLIVFGSLLLFLVLLAVASR